jgi:hypothetical protein
MELLGKGSARRKASAYTGQHNTEIHPPLERDWNLRFQYSSHPKPSARPLGPADCLNLCNNSVGNGLNKGKENKISLEDLCIRLLIRGLHGQEERLAMLLRYNQPSWTLAQLLSSSPTVERAMVDLHETAINPRPRPNINLPSSRTWNTGRLCRTTGDRPFSPLPQPPNPLPLPSFAPPTNRTFLTWRCEVNESSANYERAESSGPSPHLYHVPAKPPPHTHTQLKLRFCSTISMRIFIGQSLLF